MSWLKFCSINLSIIAVSTVKYISQIFIQPKSLLTQITSDIVVVACETIIVLAMVKFMDFKTNKPRIHSLTQHLQSTQHPQHTHIIKNTIPIIILKSFIHLGVLHYTLQQSAQTLEMSQIFAPFIFIGKSFIFEVIFDFGHYWLHRAAHLPFIYKLIHKKHHIHKHPQASTTFYMNPIDLIFTYGGPLIIGVFVIPFSKFEFACLTTYLTYQEIAGHLGKHTTTSSFAQCIWLPRMLKIELMTKDHDYHHTSFKYNFSKRFKLWDVFFGTFKEL